MCKNLKNNWIFKKDASWRCFFDLQFGGFGASGTNFFFFNDLFVDSDYMMNGISVRVAEI